MPAGVRRIVPGATLASDPKGRAIMIGLSFVVGWVEFTVAGATEKHKLVYIMNRDAAARLTISSPLEAHKVWHLTDIL